MTTHVYARQDAALRDCVKRDGGTQTGVAERAGMTLSRLNQLCTGKDTGIPVRLAARLEDALGVPRGTLFTADRDAVEFLAPYLVVRDGG